MVYGLKPDGIWRFLHRFMQNKNTQSAEASRGDESAQWGLGKCKFGHYLFLILWIDLLDQLGDLHQYADDQARLQ